MNETAMDISYGMQGNTQNSKPMAMCLVMDFRNGIQPVWSICAQHNPRKFDSTTGETGDDGTWWKYQFFSPVVMMKGF